LTEVLRAVGTGKAGGTSNSNLSSYENYNRILKLLF